MNNKSVTRNDVAKLAGVSPAVVSYVVNSSKYVSEAKKEAVLRAIRELHYRPNLQARSLRTKQSMQIAFVCDNLRNDWLEQPEKMLFDKGYYVSHCYSRDEDSFIQMLIDRRFDGIFMQSNRYSTSQLRQIADAGIPIVLYKTRNYGDLGSNIITVVPDIYDSIVKAVNYLALRGHRNLALLLPVRYRSTGIDSEGFREKAYVQALTENGLPVDNTLLCTRTDSIEEVLAGVNDMLIGGGVRPDAIIASTDYMAAQVISYVRQMGFRVPQDVAVMGADNTYLATMMTPMLTSVDFSKDAFAKALTETMLGLMRGEQREDIYIPVEVKVRESA